VSTNGNALREEVAADAIGPEGDLLATVDPIGFGEAIGKLAFGCVLNPLGVAQSLGSFASGLLAVSAATAGRALGADSPGPVEVGKKDRRFSDAAWQENPAYFFLQQGYLLFGQLVRDLVEAGAPPADRKIRFLAEIVVDGLAPTNFLPGNPAALKRAFETAGGSLVRGARNFAEDAMTNGGLPRQVNRSEFEVGRDLAATAGKVVLRNEFIELIQYAPQTETVYDVPLLLSPPWINKYYVMDLAPGRSFAEWAVQHGHTVFALSYRNPDESMRDVTLDDYLVHGPRAAIAAIEEITGAPQVNVVGLCLGGTLTGIMLAYLHKHDPDRVRSATLLNTILDFSEPGVLGAFTDDGALERIIKKMERRGFLESSEMARTFTFLRGNDLIWNYVANNWLMGEQPPKFDLLAWNDDSTRMPARMHAFTLRSCYQRNDFAHGELELLGEQLSPRDITADVYVLAAIEDHIAPWRSQYMSTGLLGGDVRFVLSSAGHIAGIVNPPSPKTWHWVNDDLSADADSWLERAERRDASWWEDWTAWIAERAGEQREPPPLGTKLHPALGNAPGTYVLAT
jgi:polyhydroxyalkanoate synthase